MKSLNRHIHTTLNKAHQFSSGKGPVSVANCSIPEYLDEPSLPPQNQDTSIPASIDYSHFVNEISSKRQPSHLREISSMLEKLPPTCIKFGVGVPNGLTFPFKKISVELNTNESIELQGKELSAALQYLPSVGYRPLIHLLQEIQDSFHGTQSWEKKSIMITSGAQEGLSKAVDMCVERNDSVLIPDPIYTGAIDMFRPYDADIIPIKQDSYGVVVEDIENILKERKQRKQPIPKLIYLNPTASNPAGTTLPENRKREIYRLACEYNILILEDDPYYFLHFDKDNPTSFLSMDTEDRVLRFDSFSKILSSGIRLGFITGPTRLLRQMELHLQITTLHASSLSQLILYKLLSNWGQEGLNSHFAYVKNFYKQKRDYMMMAVEKNLTGLAEWHEPNGGMFLWLKIIGLNDTKQLVATRCLEKLVILAPGYAFATNVNSPSPYVRISYSIASPEEVDLGMSLLAEAIREERQSM